MVYYIKKKRLALKYALIWLFAGICMGVLLVFPKTIFVLGKILGVEVPANGLFLCVIFFLVLISLSLTAIVSKQTDKINILIQENAILEKRVREIEMVIEKGA